jgi:hypothetical protein
MVTESKPGVKTLPSHYPRLMYLHPTPGTWPRIQAGIWRAPVFFLASACRAGGVGGRERMYSGVVTWFLGVVTVCRETKGADFIEQKEETVDTDIQNSHLIEPMTEYESDAVRLLW